MKNGQDNCAVISFAAFCSVRMKQDLQLMKTHLQLNPHAKINFILDSVYSEEIIAYIHSELQPYALTHSFSFEKKNFSEGEEYLEITATPINGM